MSQQTLNRFWGLFLFLSAVALLPGVVKAQELEIQQWRQGQVLLTNGDTLSGAIVYHLKGEMLQVKLADGATKTYSPVNVTSFTVLNEEKSRFQTFRSYPWSRRSAQSAFKTPAFFEVVAEGKYTLVKREAFAVRNLDPVPRYASSGRYYEPSPDKNPAYKGYYSQVVVVNQFYVLTPGKEIVALRHPKKDLPALFRDKAGAMDRYMKNKSLSYHNSSDLIPVIRHFNKL